jgi:peroxiredoxin
MMPDPTRRLAVLALVGVAATGQLGACGGRDAAPDFSYTLLDGSQGHTQALRGKVVLLNFWATNCSACVQEMPQITGTHQKFKSRGFDTLAVAMSYDPPAAVADFAESRRLPFGVVIDNTGSIAKGFGDLKATPTTYLIDKRGAIAKRYVGASDFDALHTLIERLLLEA